MSARVAPAAGHEADGASARAAVAADDLRADALWLTTLQTICARAAHDVRGALNAVAVNMEVVRVRADKPDVPASAVSSFAAVAAGQLDQVITMTEALMFLVRSARTPVDLGAEVSRIVDLLAPAAKTAGRTIELDRTFDGLGTTSASSSSARLAIGRSLLAAADASTRVRCVAVDVDGSPALRLEHDAGEVAVDAAVADALATAGITVQSEPSAITIGFPR